MEDGSAGSEVDNGGPAQEASERSNSSCWAKVHSQDILAEDVTAFCLCLKNLPEAKLVSLGQIMLTVGMSKQPNTGSVV